MLLLHRCALHKFHMTDSQNTRDQIMKGGRSKHAFCAFHSFLVEVQANAVYLHTYVITTWRIGLRAPLVACN